MARGLCQDCVFWDRIGASSQGECHRYGPAVRITGSSLWPPTVADTGCGEFETRPAATPSGGVSSADPGVN